MTLCSYVFFLPHDVKRTGFDQVQKTTESRHSTMQEGDRYHSLGCWKDHSSRAIPTLEGLDSGLGDMHNYKTRSNAVEKCYQAAKSRSFTVFAVQYGGQCFGSADGHNTYCKYGRSTACQADGKGGTWANEVYRISTRTVNIALGKTAVQSSNENVLGKEWNARLAVDGNTDSNHYHGSCTHTTAAGETNPSWWVDLGQPYAIERVLIFNRMDCCQERLNPFNIHIGDSDQVSTNPRCGGDHRIDVKKPSISVSCQGMKGRYVGVRLPGYNRILSLCEVNVLSVGSNVRTDGCQHGYIRVGWRCIRLVPIQKSFPDAEQACVEEGATLAMPKTKEWDHALRHLVKTSGGNFDQTWIGMRVIGTGIRFDMYELKSVDGLPLGQYRGWHPGEPASVKYLGSGDSLCVQYWYSGRTADPMWDDADCNAKNPYICQSSPA
ncbi:PREDICTED: uncharacterized protein LOC109464206 [Branchiostoma belcheri]|uniref:Uncharacterized protein LOC109464206 n=1 Tax=Branchiostoma belcheri TaxID=7741 RepID=A0A6P4Y2R1_BRABE|nr:PREDICTED: uncharacterized protein LOC109464206 [Branchiostoma belcheri]